MTAFLCIKRKIRCLTKDCMKVGLYVTNGVTSWRRGHSVRKSSRIKLYCFLIVMGITVKLRSLSSIIWVVVNYWQVEGMMMIWGNWQVSTTRQEADCHGKGSKEETCSDEAASLEPLKNIQTRKHASTPTGFQIWKPDC